MSEAPTWFVDEVEPAAQRPRRRLVPALAIGAGAWVLVATVLVRGTSDAGPPPPAPDAAPAGHHAEVPSEAPEPPTWPTPGRGPASPGPDPDGGAVARPDGNGTVRPPPAVSRQEAEALALVVVRGWLSDDGPDPGIPGLGTAPRGYLEHAAVERVDVPSEDLLVARVLTVLLLRDGDRYTEAAVRRVAVPMTLTDSDLRPAGPPWWLPTAPDLATAAPATVPVDSPEVADAVTAALEDAGYRVAVIADLRASDGGALVADVTATTPAGDEVDGPVWFGPSDDGLTVLGRPRDAGAEPPPVPRSDAPAAPEG